MHYEFKLVGHAISAVSYEESQTRTGGRTRQV
jgi:hypothetical protein